MCNEICLSCHSSQITKKSFSDPQFENAALLNCGTVEIYQCDDCHCYLVAYPPRLDDVIAIVRECELPFINAGAIFLMDAACLNDDSIRSKLVNLFEEALRFLNERIPTPTEYLFVSPRQLIAS